MTQTCGNNDKLQLSRVSNEFKDLERFKIHEKSYENQYSSIYNARLSALKDILRERAKQKWGKYRILQLNSLSESIDETESIILIGTLYKHQELKPSIIKELSEELQVISQPTRSNYSSIKDQLFLEDETLRVKLAGDHVISKEFVTGLVCAVMGRELEDGTLLVEDYCFPGICPKVSTSRSPSAEGKILLISDLDFANTPDSLYLELLVEWVTGMAGNPRDQEDQAGICFVIIAGNSVKGTVETYTHKGYSRAKNQVKIAALETTLAAHRFDKFLKRILENCPVVLMPGEFDPTNHAIPQQAIHPCILPECSRYKNFHSVTNPWLGRIGGRTIAGSSGQPIQDINKVSSLMNFSPLDWLEKTLTWRHYAPTAPDTLISYPYFECDPFIMEDCPDIYFVGNMEDYSTRLVIGDEGQTVRLISIPKFSKTRTGVLLDINSLEVTKLTFGADQG